MNSSSGQPVPRRRKSPEQRSQEIRDAALALAIEHGLAGLTLRAIAQRLGVASGLVAHYHPRMEQLVAETFEQLVGTELAEVAREAAMIADPEERIHWVVSEMLTSSRDDLTAVWVDAWSLGRRNAVLAESLRVRTREWLDFLSRCLVQAGVAQPDTAAWHILGMVDGLNAQSLVGVGDEASRDDLVQRTLALMLPTREA